MEKFQQQQDHMDVVSDAVMTQMDQTTDEQIAQSDVSQLISQVADEHQLTLEGDFQQFRMTANPTAAQDAAAAPAQAEPADDVEARLARLLGGSG